MKTEQSLTMRQKQTHIDLRGDEFDRSRRRNKPQSPHQKVKDNVIKEGLTFEEKLKKSQ